jgi:hypothetical protein
MSGLTSEERAELQSLPPIDIPEERFNRRLGLAKKIHHGLETDPSIPRFAGERALLNEYSPSGFYENKDGTPIRIIGVTEDLQLVIYKWRWTDVALIQGIKKEELKQIQKWSPHQLNLLHLGGKHGPLFADPAGLHWPEFMPSDYPICRIF